LVAGTELTFGQQESDLDCVDIHLVHMKAPTRLRMDRNALGVWS
jgi:hypothetical protein